MVNYFGPKRRRILQVTRIELATFALNDVQAGEDLSVYDTVFLDGSFVRPADAAVLATMPSLGLSQDAPASGVVGDVWIGGLVSNGSWSLTSGDPAFVASGGGLTTTAPSSSGNVVQRMGRATTETEVYLDPSVDVIQIME